MTFTLAFLLAQLFSGPSMEAVAGSTVVLPGQTATSTYTVTVPKTARVGTYPICFTVTNASNPQYTASTCVNITVKKGR